MCSSKSGEVSFSTCFIENSLVIVDVAEGASVNVDVVFFGVIVEISGGTSIGISS